MEAKGNYVLNLDGKDRGWALMKVKEKKGSDVRGWGGAA